MRIGRLHVLTDFHFQQRLSHADLAALAVMGGADTVQFRQKSGPLRARLYELKSTVDTCRAAGVPVLVNDRVDLALASGADGVHLGQDDLPIAEARRILGDDAIIGATASTVEEAKRAEDAGASYIGFGPVFATTSKANPQPIRGLHALEEAVRGVSVPVIAIAGITAARIPSVMGTGAHGVAVMTAVSLASDPAAAVGELREAIDVTLADDRDLEASR